MWACNLFLSSEHGADDLAFIHLYRQHYDLLFHIACKKTGSADDARDLVQDLFTDIWRNREKLPPSAVNRTYIISCLYNKLSNYFRSKEVREKHYNKLAHFLVQQTAYDTIDQQMEKRQLQKAARKAICEELPRMPVTMKKIVIRKVFGKQSIDQIANELLIARQTVKNQLNLASKRLKKVVDNL